jgi:YD repeat-containing protein
VTYSYDNANQFTQNGLGRLSQVSFGGGVADDFNDSYYYLYSYNAAGRVTSQQMGVQIPIPQYQNPTFITWLTFTANYQWDNEGRMTSLEYPTVSLLRNWPWQTSFSLQTAAYQYDINGRMAGMTWDSGNGDGPQPYASATYGPAGQMLTLSYGVGTETRTYNSLLQLTNQSVPGYLNMTYNYPAGQNNGRIAGSVDGITGENTTYTYDALNRLSSATASGMWSEQYSYDGFGNLTGKSQTGGAPSMTASYNAQNQQVGASYDANGNQTSANSTTNVFTVENRIKNQTSQIWPYPIAEYAYDPQGRRVMQRTDPDPDNLDTGSSPSWQYNFYGITGQRLVTMGCTNPSGTPLQPTCLVQGENVYFGRKLLVSNGVTVVTDRLGSRGRTRKGRDSRTTRMGKSGRPRRTAERSSGRTSGTGWGRITRWRDIMARGREGSGALTRAG